jgi:hypothetical protein
MLVFTAIVLPLLYHLGILAMQPQAQAGLGAVTLFAVTLLGQLFGLGPTAAMWYGLVLARGPHKVRLTCVLWRFSAKHDP